VKLYPDPIATLWWRCLRCGTVRGPYLFTKDAASKNENHVCPKPVDPAPPG